MLLFILTVLHDPRKVVMDGLIYEILQNIIVVEEDAEDTVTVVHAS